MTILVPFRIVKRSVRMELPEGVRHSRRADNTLVKALARAFRWKRMLESGEYAIIAEQAEREGIAPSYMTRVLRLTLLAPHIVEAILDGKQGPEVTLGRFLEGFPVEWEDQVALHTLSARSDPRFAAIPPRTAGRRRRRAAVRCSISSFVSSPCRCQTFRYLNYLYVDRIMARPLLSRYQFLSF
ncbi:hypothetical protein LNKW23_08360 [Paralimibaculum aggregatum]|uniref:Bacteriophage-related protein n=1 Tax=Paralimibaculum aggregatum TaxID=3036245 RepID=A0ABQ6LLC6_9RHOB|nr:hypothetical protein LNKW23_08360 [Limibaculum sp. NKW23]